ncbi:hypothetical protein NCG89_13860 [Spongiibacter taiwanensis]|uniref:hypothetical protein n=1 Tax=Spongiibacter taiwanensis TaxID=1748242 RepID=UPI0020361B3E|nr:hypothetical protein [Spongiibacter taiwanensis]USA42615.1 hypothetical protein NCG89_13860 [Spongiibacter taiwanensis]
MNNYQDKKAMTWKFCAWSGVIYLVGSLIGWAIIAGFIPPPRSEWGAAEMASFYRENNTAIKVGLVIALNFQLFYVFFSIGIAKVIDYIEGEGGLLSKLELYCGYTNFLITIAGLFFWLSAAFKAETRLDHDILLANDMGWMWIETMFLATLLQYVFVGIAVIFDKRKSKIYPGWFAWYSFATAFAMWPVSLIPFLYSGPFAYHGLISLYLVYGMYFLWTGVASVYTVKAINRIVTSNRLGTE